MQKARYLPSLFCIFVAHCDIICDTMNHNTEHIDQILTAHGIRPTAIRAMVMRNLHSLPEVFTLADAEEMMDSVDRSTLFRTLELFAEAGVLHVDSIGGVKRYCLCTCHDHDHHKESHIHVTCRICGHTFCIKDQSPTIPALPDGFEVESVACAIEGVCGECRRRKG